MRFALKARILRVADQVAVLSHFAELVKAMTGLSDAWSASSADMKRGLETHDVDLLSKAILENRKQAEQMSFVLRRYERIMSNLKEKDK